MLTKFLIGRAAKAGIALLTGLFTTASGAAIVDQVAHSEPALTFIGYIIIGAIGGLANWASVYFKKNAGTRYDGPGLY